MKYHLGTEVTRSTRVGEIEVTLSSTRATSRRSTRSSKGRASRADDRGTRKGSHDPTVGAPGPDPWRRRVPGARRRRGNAEPLRRSGLLDGRHAARDPNNQIGFTTDPGDARSTRYSSDLARVSTCRSSTSTPTIRSAPCRRLASAFRRGFASDVVDRPRRLPAARSQRAGRAAFTQPLMAPADRAHPPVRELYAQQLVAEGVVTEDEAAAAVDAAERS